MSGWGDHVRLVVDDSFEIVVVALVLVSLVGGAVAYMGAQAGERTDTRTVSSWESSGDFTHQATVMSENEAFREGTVLRNRSVYFQQIAPILNGTFTHRYRASEGGELTANTSISLVMRSVETNEDRSSTEYWRVEDRLDSERTALSPGESVRLSFSQNTTAAERRIDQISQQIGETPGETQAFIEAQVNLSGTRNGQSVDRTRVYQLPITFESGIYRVDDPGTVTYSGTQREQVVVPTGRNLGQAVLGGLVFVLAGGAAIGLVIGRKRNGPFIDEATRERLAFESERKEFDDWITTGRLPEAGIDGPRISVDSLEGLVDMAIDTNNRVIETPDGKFVVLGEDVVYVFDAPESVTGDERLFDQVVTGEADETAADAEDESEE